MSKPVSKYAFMTTGSVPQVGPAATALADGLAAVPLADAAGVVAVGAVDDEGATEAPGAQAPAMMANTERPTARIPGLRTDRCRVNDPTRLTLST
jgi:hypothetical protein